MFDRVLILSASAGAGHVRAAQALERGFARYGGAEHVRHVDTLDFTSKFFRDLYSKAYLEFIKRAPTALGWFYDRFDKPYHNERLRLVLNKLNTTRFAKMLEEHKPDLALCTHFLPAEIVSRLKHKGRMSCPLAVVVTDLDVHAMWLCHEVDHYFVAMEETRVHLTKLGVPAERVTVTGIPIDPIFTEPKDAPAMRAKHGLREGVATILLSAGGFGVGPVEKLMGALLDLKHDAQVVAICGKNEALREKLKTVVASRKSPTKLDVKVLGYTTEMDELMSASDLLVGKPGGLTTSEALARGLPLVVVNPIPGQEERNSDHLLEEGVAIRCNNLPTIAYKIDALLGDPARLERMRTNVKRFARPHAAREIIQALASLPTDRPASIRKSRY